MLDGSDPRVEIYITILEEIPVQEKLYVESDARD